MINYATKIIASGLGLGYSPVIPGTIGSLLGIAIFLLLKYFGLSLLVITVFTIVLFFIGVIVSTKAEKLFNKKDPSVIVIDEIVGALLFLSFIPLNFWYVIFGFIIYRIYDIIKPYPAKQAENLHSGWGIMLDDIFAGIYTIITVRIIYLMIH